MAVSDRYRAPGFCMLGGDRTCRPFPRAPNTSCKTEVPASLRSDGVRVQPGMPFGFPSESAFGFAGILIQLTGGPRRSFLRRQGR
jgi:hypothetical protein